MTEELQAENERLRAEIAELKGEAEPSVDTQIEQAESDGDWVKAGYLKVGQLSGEQSGISTEAQEQIRELEEAGDWFGAGQAKVAALRETSSAGSAVDQSVAAEPAGEDIATQIREAEAEGDWYKAMTLKLQRSGIRV